nr:diacylglycerol kinase 7-like [Ipomoea batatas]
MKIISLTSNSHQNFDFGRPILHKILQEFFTATQLSLKSQPVLLIYSSKPSLSLNPSVSIVNPKIIIPGQLRNPLWLLCLALSLNLSKDCRSQESQPASPLAYIRSGAHCLAPRRVAGRRSASQSHALHFFQVPTMKIYSWKLVISMPAGEELETPHSLKSAEDLTLDQVIVKAFI